MADNVYAMLRAAWAVSKIDDANIFGVEIAIVTNVKDPEKQGRVKICFPRLPGKPESDWARVRQPAAGSGRGFYWLPHVDDEVLVAFERGQANLPYVIGSLWNGKDKPMKDAYTDENTTIMVQSKSGHQVILSDKDGEEKISIADKTGKRALTWDVKGKKFLVECKEGDFEVRAEKKIVLSCEDLEIKTKKTGKIRIGSTFNLAVKQKLQFKAGPKIDMKADQVNLNPPSLVESLLQGRRLSPAAMLAGAVAAAEERAQEVAAGAADAVSQAARSALSSGPGGGIVPSTDVVEQELTQALRQGAGGLLGTEWTRARDALAQAAAAVESRPDEKKEEKKKEEKIDVRELILDGPAAVSLKKKITIKASAKPDVGGTFAWHDSSGKKIGEGRELVFEGRRKSDKDGDQPIECRFTSASTGKVVTQKHPITVRDTPTLTLPINLGLSDMTEADPWLRLTPFEVRVDDNPIAFHTNVVPPFIYVSFRLDPGEHTVVITSGPRDPPKDRPPVRIVHFSAKLKVTEDAGARAVQAKNSDGSPPLPARDPKLGRGYSMRGIKAPPKKPVKPKR